MIAAEGLGKNRIGETMHYGASQEKFGYHLDAFTFRFNREPPRVAAHSSTA